MSSSVTAITIEAKVFGCSGRVGLATIHPATGRNRADGGAGEAERDAAAAPPTANEQRARANASRNVIGPCLRQALRTRSEIRHLSRAAGQGDHRGQRRSCGGNGPLWEVAITRLPCTRTCQMWRAVLPAPLGQSSVNETVAFDQTFFMV